MSFEKSLDREIFTPADEKDYLDSAHASEDEMTIFKNKEKIEAYENAANNGESVEEDDSFSNKESMRFGVDPEGDRANQPGRKGKDYNEQLIRHDRKVAPYRKTA
jgi:hypothetical protein